MSRARMAALWLVGAAAGVLLLWIALRSTPLDEVRRILSDASAGPLIGVVACGFGFVAVKALRWRWLLLPLKQLRFRNLVGPVLAGSAVNYVLPHGGELARAWMVASTHSLPKAALLATIGVERLFDFCAVLALGLIAIVAGQAAVVALGDYLWVLAAFIAALLAAVAPFVLRPAESLAVLRALTGRLPAGPGDWVARQVAHGIEGLAALQRGTGAGLPRLFAVSLVQWMLMAACAWFSLRAVDAASEPAAAVVVVLLLVVGLTLPAAPGHVGTTQVAFLVGAAPFGVGNAEAIAASLVYNVFLPVPILVTGLAALLISARRRQAGGSPR